MWLKPLRSSKDSFNKECVLQQVTVIASARHLICQCKRLKSMTSQIGRSSWFAELSGFLGADQTSLGRCRERQDW
eukprot:5060843-Amphidinium_carterae.1